MTEEGFLRACLPAVGGVELLFLASFSSCSLLTVKFRQPNHEFTFGVGINFISYPLVLTPLV
jgi:hypothetical protein